VVPIAGRTALARLRESGAVWVVLAVAPVPIAVALVLTARPVYPPDACFYGAPASSIRATDDYLSVMTPLGMFAMAAVAIVALPARGRWRLLAPAVTVWAAVTLFREDAGRPVMVFGGNVVVFGGLLLLAVVVIVVLAGRESSWVRAIGWFEFLFLLPLLLGIAGLLAQPACYNGDPPAPVPR
jgi:hypothetical protein